VIIQESQAFIYNSHINNIIGIVIICKTSDIALINPAYFHAEYSFISQYLKNNH